MSVKDAKAHSVGRLLSIGAPSAVAYRGSAVDLKAVEKDWALINELFIRDLKFVQDAGTIFDPKLAKDNLLSRVRDFFSTPAPLHVLVYLGHGFDFTGDWVLINPGCMPATVSQHDLWQVWSQTQSKRGAPGHLFIYMDSCHSGAWVDLAAQYKFPDSIQASTDRKPSVDGFFTERWVQFVRGTLAEDALLKACDGYCVPRAWSGGRQIVPLLNKSFPQLTRIYAFDGVPGAKPAVVAPTHGSDAKAPTNPKDAGHKTDHPDAKAVVPGAAANTMFQGLKSRIAAAIDLLQKSDELKSAIGARLDSLRDGMLVRQRDTLQIPLHHRIAIVGQTGAGKTTLINNLIGCDLLHTEDGKVDAITWCSTTIATDPSAPLAKCRVTRKYYTSDDWRRRRGVLFEVKGRVKARDDTEKEDEKAITAKLEERLNKAALKALYTLDDRKRIAALKHDDAFESADVLTRLDRAESTDWLSFEEARAQLKNIAKLVSDDAKAKFVFNDWPLIEQIEVVGAFPTLPPYVTLVDTPGTQDPSEKRAQICDFNSFIRGCTRVWYIVGGDDRITKAVAEDLHELKTCGVLERAACIRTKCDAVRLPVFETWAKEMRSKLVNLTPDAQHMPFFRVAHEIWCAYRDVNKPNSNQDELRDILSGGRRFGYTDVRATGYPMLLEVLGADSHDAVHQMYSQALHVNLVLDQLLNTIAHPAQAAAAAVDQKAAAAVLDAAKEATTVIGPFEGRIASALSIPALATGRNEFKIDQKLVSLLEAAAYNTLQAFFRRRGDWRPDVIDWIWKSFLASSGVEQHWVTLFDKQLPDAVGSVCSDILNACVKAINLIPPSNIQLHRLMLTSGVNAAAAQSRKRCLQLLFEARQGLQRGIGQCIRVYLVKHPTFFDGIASGSGCRRRMQNYILHQLSDMAPLYDHVVQHVQTELKETVLAPLSAESKMLADDMLNQFSSVLSPPLSAKTLSLALLDEFAKLGCDVTRYRPAGSK